MERLEVHFSELPERVVEAREAIKAQAQELDHAYEDKRSINKNEGKLRPSVILKDMQAAFHEVLKAREYGAKKYSRMNWAASIGEPEQHDFLDDNMDSIYRHLIASTDEDLDRESGCYHLANVAVRCLIALEYAIAAKA